MKISFTSFDSTRGFKDNQETKVDQDAKKSFCLLRFEVNWTSAAEDVENFATFSVHRVLYTSAP